MALKNAYFFSAILHRGRIVCRCREDLYLQDCRPFQSITFCSRRQPISVMATL